MTESTQVVGRAQLTCSKLTRGPYRPTTSPPTMHRKPATKMVRDQTRPLSGPLFFTFGLLALLGTSVDGLFATVPGTLERASDC
ncbi:MAG: hypothetical protein WC935_07890 [Thermoleophilia bacterium]